MVAELTEKVGLNPLLPASERAAAGRLDIGSPASTQTDIVPSFFFLSSFIVGGGVASVRLTGERDAPLAPIEIERFDPRRLHARGRSSRRPIHNEHECS